MPNGADVHQVRGDLNAEKKLLKEDVLKPKESKKEGRLVVSGGEYAYEEKRDEAPPDFDNDEKHLRDPEI